MRKVTLAILGAAAWLSQVGPVNADGWCWACARSCPDCKSRSWSPRERWNPEVRRGDAYHEIFGDGPGAGRGSGRRKRKAKPAAKTAGAPASTATHADANAAAAPPPADGAAK